MSSVRARVSTPCALAGLVASACLGTPTPLAPAISGSVGLPYHGVLTGPVELPVQGDGFVRFRPASTHYWGNARLVHAVQSAAARVAQIAPGGAPLVVGDFSQASGGQIPGHRSHRTGRDADLLFFASTPAGASIKSPGFVHFAADGLAALQSDESSTYVRLDIEREWLLVRELLASREALVQFMFVSRDLEALLVDYARARGEPLELIYEAESVLLQPKDSTPHDDHLHLRIACAPDETVAGCEDGNTRWDWLPPGPASEELDAIALEQIAGDDPLPADTAQALSLDTAKRAPLLSEPRQTLLPAEANE